MLALVELEAVMVLIPAPWAYDARLPEVLVFPIGFSEHLVNARIAILLAYLVSVDELNVIAGTAPAALACIAEVVALGHVYTFLQW